MNPQIGIAAWIHGIAGKTRRSDFEVTDLRPLPLFNERGSLAWEPIKTEVAQRWAAKLAGLDGFILITSELLPGYLNFKES